MNTINEDTRGVFLVIPAYNEATRIQPVIEEVSKRGYKMIIVNDGSVDKTLEIIRTSQKKYPNNIFIVSHVLNCGLGAALKTGMELALKHNAEYIVTFDGDGQHSVDDIKKVVKPLKDKKADAVIGARPFEDMPGTKNFANTIMNILTRIFYRTNVRDSQSGLRAFTANAANKIDIVSPGYGVSSEIIKEINDNNLKLNEVTITTIYDDETQNKGTNAKVGIMIMFKMIRDLFK